MVPLENVKPVKMKETENGVVITLEIDQEAINHVKASMQFFHDDQPLDRKLAEYMQVALVKFAWGRKNAIL